MHVSVESRAVVSSGKFTGGLSMTNPSAQLILSTRPSKPDRFAANDEDCEDHRRPGASVVFFTLLSIPAGAAIWMLVFAWFI
jgi:hypothetical protein